MIDDDPVDREIFRLALEAAQPGGFVYAEASLGREGLARLETFQPDCVLLDLNLPDVDGLQMIRSLHDRRDPLPCAVVMLTGTGNEQIAVDAMKMGVMDYLPKGPESSQTLARTVTGAVQRFRLQQQIEEQRRALEQRNRDLEAIRSELFAEKERYRVLAESIPQLVWAADPEGHLDYANERLWEFSGRQAGADGGATWQLTSLVRPEDRAELREQWAEAVRSGRPFEMELRLLRSRDRTWRRHLMRAAPMRAGEEGVRWFGTFTDIEDQRRAEEALRQRQKLESIGLLAGGIAHDFNNLLVGIMGGASFALDSLGPDHPTRPMLEIVARSSERAAHLTRQLLAYSGKGQAFPESVDLSRVARQSGERLRNSIPPGVTLVLDTDDTIPPLQADASQMEQVVANLVINAGEAIEGTGVVRVRTAVERIGADNSRTNIPGDPLPPGRYALIEVSDSGSGMDEATIKQIFDPFFTTRFTGRGLGLAAVQGIVRTLSGGIQVQSEPGKGSTFRVLLPLKATAGEKRVILVIGADPRFGAPAASALKRSGYEVLLATAGNEAVETLASRREIDLVLLDADRSGWQETLTRVRGLSTRAPVAILTGNPEELARGFTTPGMVEIIRKTTDPASMEESIVRVLAVAAGLRAAGGRESGNGTAA